MAGPRSFTPPHWRLGLWVNGYWFHNASGWMPGRGSLAGAVGPVVLPTEAGAIVQHRWVGGDAPVNLNRRLDRMAFEFQLMLESDFELIEDYASRGTALRVWLDAWMVDTWYIPGANAAQTTWRTSRHLPWDIAGVSHATRAPSAYFEDASGNRTPLTIVTSGTPNPGEIKIPDSGGTFGDLETEVVENLTDTYLVVRYPPVFHVVMDNVQREVRGPNDIRVGFELTEIPAGVYTVAA